VATHTHSSTHSEQHTHSSSKSSSLHCPVRARRVVVYAPVQHPGSSPCSSFTALYKSNKGRLFPPRISPSAKISTCSTSPLYLTCSASFTFHPLAHTASLLTHTCCSHDVSHLPPPPGHPRCPRLCHLPPHLWLGEMAHEPRLRRDALRPGSRRRRPLPPLV